MSAFTATAQEWQAYSYYVHRLSNSIGGVLDLQFWQDIVLQSSHSCPPVRYAVYAVANLFRHENTTCKFDCDCQYKRTALRYYNKSIVDLPTDLASCEPIHIPLLTCVLFICIESIQHNDENVLALIERGCLMLQELPGSLSTRSGEYEYLVAAFRRLRVLSSLFGRSVNYSQNIYDDSLATSSEFENTGRARNALYSILNSVLDFRRMATDGRRLPILNKARVRQLHDRQRQLKKSHADWYRAFQKSSQTWKLRKDSRETDSVHHENSLALLETQFLISSIWAVTALYVEESLYDQHFEQFKVIVENSQSILRTRCSDTAEQSEFRFELGLIPALYVVAIKCRDPDLRRQALSLLTLTPNREGMWHSAESASVAERVIELEEIVMKGKLFHEVKVGLRYVEMNRWKVNVTYIWRESQEMSSWSSMTETLTVDSHPSKRMDLVR